MSDKLPEQPQNEEVDLGQLFKAIGKLFENLFNFIKSIFKGVFSAIIFAIKPLIIHFKLVVIAVILTAVLGYIMEKSKKPVYSSDMVVKPYFDSKYQLANNINYFNSLIQSENVIELSNIFEIDTSLTKALVRFDLEAGPETKNDLFIEYGEYVEAIDTSLVDELSYEKYVKNRELLSGSLFAIKATAHKNDVFTHLGEGFRKTFENDFSKHRKKVRDTVAYLENLSLTTELSRLDSIQKTYLEAIKNESKKKNLSLAMGSMLPVQEEKTATKEYELFIKEQEIRRNLNILNKSIAEENTYYEVLSGFDTVGAEDKSLKQRYYIVFPLLTLLLIVLGFLALKAFKFIKNYE